MASSSLTVANIHAGYSAVRVLEDESLNVGAGETVALLQVDTDEVDRVCFGVG